MCKVINFFYFVFIVRILKCYLNYSLKYMVLRFWLKKVRKNIFFVLLVIKLGGGGGGRGKF